MNLRWTISLAVSATVLVLAGCSKEPASQAEATKEVRGEPINSTPAPTPTPVVVAAEPAKSATLVETVANAPAAPVAPSPAPVPTPTAKADGEFAEVGFDFLAGFEYAMPDETNVSTNAPAQPAKEQIPPNIKALDKKRVALKGFMLPLKVEGGLITELLIMRDQSMCCYGTVPKINEWVSVKMINKGVKPVMDQAITLYGALKVGEMYENGYLVGIYQLDGEKMAGPLDL
jgi:hypothetical protein